MFLLEKFQNTLVLLLSFFFLIFHPLYTPLPRLVSPCAVDLSAQLAFGDQWDRHVVSFESSFVNAFRQRVELVALGTSRDEHVCDGACCPQHIFLFCSFFIIHVVCCII